MTRKILVTGGAGFIGSHLVDRLIAMGDEVTVLDDLSGGTAGYLDPRARLIRGDVRDADHLVLLVRGMDAVFHLAAKVSVQACIEDWDAGHRVNLGGTIGVLRAAHRAGGVPVVYASSAAVYGDQGDLAGAEDALPLPISPYAADKLAGEHQARAMARVHGLPSVGLRFFNVYGPRQDACSAYAGVISKLCANRLAGRAHVIFGDGLQSRDFIHVTDVVDSLLLGCQLASATGAGAEVFNICTGTATTLLDLAAQIDRASGGGATPILHEPPRSGDIRHSRGDPRAARDRLGFQATIPMRQGLADTLDWMRGTHTVGQPALLKGSVG